MSSARPGDDRSPEADRPEAREAGAGSLPAVVKLRGAALLEGLERHLGGSAEHAEATASYALVAAAELGFDRAHAELVREVAKLHEVGMVYAPAELLVRSRAALSEEDRARLDSHPLAGAELARGAGVPDAACEWIRCSGERFGGGGPAGMVGKAIPVESRVIHAACACDRLLSAPLEPVEGAAPAPTSRPAHAAARLRAAATRADLDPTIAEALAATLERTTRGA